MQKKATHHIQSEKDLDSINLDLIPGDRIFFYGDLGSGKTALIRSILRKVLQDDTLIVRSPTYTYYQKFENIYHFDLYRIEDTETFSLIGGDDIWDDPSTICLIEWPERLSQNYQATKTIRIEKFSGTERKIEVS